MYLLNRLTSPILLQGDDAVAFRDPAALWVDGEMRLYYTLVETPSGQAPLMTVAESRSRDLQHWSASRRLTPYDRSKNFSSPGCVVRDGDDYVMCLQTYCRENGEKYGNDRCRLYTMRSRDLETWSDPEPLLVKGEGVPMEAMGRMIDPFLLRYDEMWWCFYKQNGMNLATSPDLRHWHDMGHVRAGENACVIRCDDGFLLFHSPHNGIGVKDSKDLMHWRVRQSTLRLGQRCWPWARGRITAAFVLDGRNIPELQRYIMLYHGTGPEDEETIFDTNASIGIAWSQDLRVWDWPGKRGKRITGRLKPSCALPTDA